MVKIIQEIEKCIGCGACAALDPTNWEMNGDKAVLKGGTESSGIATKDVDAVGASKDAANSCPTQCIKVEE
ncbi:MAG: ferredoxin [Candidatus Diapherotrites archaeon]|jgi:ferredoxin|nr:ferredoxin [Candidatus Diapherotrites archaeon]